MRSRSLPVASAGMGALKPWHILTVLICLTSIVATVVGAIAIARTTSKRR